MIRRGLTAFLLAATLTGCDQELPSPKQQDRPRQVIHENTQAPVTPEMRQALERYRDKGRDMLSGCMECAANLRRQAATFLQAPDEDSFRDLIALARHCRQRYEASVALTGTYSSLDARLASLRHRIDSRPITPGYVDYVQDYPDSGIVNDPALPLTMQNLIAEQGLTDPADVVLGYEVILFLLEGEHRYKPAVPLRQWTDYIPAKEWATPQLSEALPLSEHPSHRRRRYLELAIDIMAQDTGLLNTAWQDWTLPDSQDAAQALLFSIVRNWHSVASSLPMEDTGEVTDLLIDLVDSKQGPGVATLAGLVSLDGWPHGDQPADPIRLGQAVGNWLNQHYTPSSPPPAGPQ